MFLPYITGDWSSDNMQWNIGSGGGLALALTWLYFMGWSCLRLRGGGGLRARVPLAGDRHAESAASVGGVLGAGLRPAAARARWHAGDGGGRGRPDVHRVLHAGVRRIVGDALGNVMVFCLVAGLILSMNTATMDGSRALFGIARDGMTIKQLGVLNKFNVPAGP